MLSVEVQDYLKHVSTSRVVSSNANSAGISEITNILISQLIMCFFGMFQRSSYETLVGYEYKKHFRVTNKNGNQHQKNVFT